MGFQEVRSADLDIKYTVAAVAPRTLAVAVAGLDHADRAMLQLLQRWGRQVHGRRPPAQVSGVATVRFARLGTAALHRKAVLRRAVCPGAQRWLSDQPAGSRADHFARFSLEPSFNVDLKALKSHYQDLQRGFHPDTLSANGITAPHEVAAAQAESASINDSYAVLLSSLRRAEHLLELAGDGLTEGDGVADSGLLMQVMEWREDIEDAQDANDAGALASLREEFLALQAAAEEGVAAAWETEPPDLDVARAATIRLKYTRRALEEIEGLLPAA